jgi:DNA transformation protein
MQLMSNVRPQKEKAVATPTPKKPQAGQAAAESEVATLAKLANLGPKSAQFMQRAGITSIEQLKRLGSVRAYSMVKHVEPSASLNLLWALEGALSGLHWQEVAKEHRTSLLLALETHEQGKKRKAGA